MATVNREPIIDMHLHAHKPESVPAGAPAFCEPPPCQSSGSATSSSAETLRRTLEAMDRCNVVLGFLSGDLDVVYERVKSAPDRFLPSPMFNGLPGSPSVELLRGEYAAGRLQAMGEITIRL